jgi:hypothetical protein
MGDANADLARAQMASVEFRDAIGYAIAAFFSQNRQPCMSGDPRDRLLPHQKRDLEDAVCTIEEEVRRFLKLTPEAFAALATDEGVVMPRVLSPEQHKAVVKLDFTSRYDPSWPEYYDVLTHGNPYLVQPAKQN